MILKTAKIIQDESFTLEVFITPIELYILHALFQSINKKKHALHLDPDFYNNINTFLVYIRVNNFSLDNDFDQYKGTSEY